MRVHISLDDELVRVLDERVGRRRRSAFIASAVTRALDDERRWQDIFGAIGALDGGGQDWTDDPAAWVRDARRADDRRAG